MERPRIPPIQVCTDTGCKDDDKSDERRSPCCACDHTVLDGQLLTQMNTNVVGCWSRFVDLSHRLLQGIKMMVSAKVELSIVVISKVLLDGCLYKYLFRRIEWRCNSLVLCRRTARQSCGSQVCHHNISQNDGYSAPAGHSRQTLSPDNRSHHFLQYTPKVY